MPAKSVPLRQKNMPFGMPSRSETYSEVIFSAAVARILRAYMTRNLALV